MRQGRRGAGAGAVRRRLFAWLLLLVWPFLLPAGGALAQPLGAEGGTLASLLGQLQALQESGVLGGLEGGPGGSLLDSTRERNIQDLSKLGQETRASEGGEPQGQAGRSMEVLQLIDRLCQGALTAEQIRQLRPMLRLSLIEEDYCQRLAEPIFQYGYELLEREGNVKTLDVGAIPDTYVLGIADELIVTFHGQDNRTVSTKVDREGRILLPGWAPMAAAGRPFGDVRREIEVRTATTKLGTEVFVSLGAVRVVSVLVLGEVTAPGRRQLSALSTALDAIAEAGGVKRTGSLRRIQLLRGDSVTWIDIYELLYAGVAARDLTLRDGDQIIVPPLGATVALSGGVLRPGIYELAEGERTLTVAEALALAGGTIRPRGNRFVQVTIAESGAELVVERDNLAARLQDGDMLIVARRGNFQAGGVHLDGHVRVPGRRSLANVTTVAELLGDVTSLKRDAYLQFGALETTDPATRARRLFPLNMQRILDGEEDYALRDGDRLVIMSARDVRFLQSRDVHDILRDRVEAPAGVLAPAQPGAPAQQAQASAGESDRAAQLQRLLGLGTDNAAGANAAAQQVAAGVTEEPLTEQMVRIRACPGLLRLTSVMANQSVERFTSALITRSIADDLRRLDVQPCPRVYQEFPELLPLALEFVVTVNGAVREPGLFPVVGDVPITSIIAVSGGLSRDVDLTRVEVSRHIPDSVRGEAKSSRGLVDLAKAGAENVKIAAGDVVRFNAVFTDRDSGPVVLAGEFIRPGIYEIRRGERLSEVIARAGGLTPQAYPYGAIFTRESVKLAQEIGLRRAARELESAIAVAAVQRGINPATIIGAQQVSQQLDTIEALGRVVIEADPTVLQVRPELDPVLEPGDRLFMPKRPNFVAVIGDVLNPGAMQFVAGTTADRYISQAGGLQKSADDDRIFVVYPNGAAEPLTVSVWNFQAVQVPPGSSIVVPKDPAPVDFATLLRDGTQIVGQLAIAAASLAVISRN